MIFADPGASSEILDSDTPAFKIFSGPPTYYHMQTTQEPEGEVIYLLFSLRG